MNKVFVFSFIETLNEEQVNLLKDKLQTFLSDWKAHGKPVSSEFEILKDRFLVVKSNVKCGSAIDRFFAFILKLFEENNFPIAEDDVLFFEIDGAIVPVKYSNLKDLILQGKIKEDTVYYDRTVMHTGDIDNFITTAGNSWLKKFFNTVNV